MEYNKARTHLKEKFLSMISKTTRDGVYLTIIFFLAGHAFFHDKETILIPPELTEEAKVSTKWATKSYFQGFVWMLVTNISQITPSNAREIYKMIEPYFSKEIWKNLGPQILEIEKNPNFTGANIYSAFAPESMEYEPNTKTFYVYGKLTSSQYRQGQIKTFRSIYATYEIRMKKDGLYPQVVHWRPYEGVPMTEKWKQKHPDQAAKREAALQKNVESRQIYPHAEEQKIFEENGATPVQSMPEKPAATTTKSASAATAPATAASQVLEGIKPPLPEQKAAFQNDLL